MPPSEMLAVAVLRRQEAIGVEMIPEPIRIRRHRGVHRDEARLDGQCETLKHALPVFTEGFAKVFDLNDAIGVVIRLTSEAEEKQLHVRRGHDLPVMRGDRTEHKQIRGTQPAPFD